MDPECYVRYRADFTPHIDGNCSNWVPVNTNKQIWLIIMVNKIFIIVDHYGQVIYHFIVALSISVRREDLGLVASNQNRSQLRFLRHRRNLRLCEFQCGG